MAKASGLSVVLAATAIGLFGASKGAQAQELSIADHDSIMIDGSTFKVLAGKAKADISAEIKKPGVHELGSGAIVFRSGDKLYILEANVSAPGALLSGDRRRFAYDAAGRYAPDDPKRPNAYDGGDPRRFAYDTAGRYVPENPARPNAYDGGDPRRFAYDAAGRYVPDNPARPNAYDGGDPRRFAYDAAGRYVPDDPKRPNANDAADPRRFNYDPTGRYVPDPTRPNAYDAGDPRHFAVDGGSNRGTMTSGAGSSELIRDRNPVYIDDPDYAIYRLKKIFSDNWTTVK